MKKLAKLFGIFALLFLTIALIWNYLPNKRGPFPADPAVVYANEAFTGNLKYKEGYHDHEGQSLHYVEVGEGPMVVLIHGFPAYWYGMIRQMEALKSNYRVVAIDALGAGLSDAPRDTTAYTLEANTAHLRVLIENLNGSEKVNLIGHDWGGAYAFSFAQNYPEHVRSIVGIASPPPTVLLNLLETNEKQRETSNYVSALKKANPILLKALKAPEKIWDGAYQELVDAGELNKAESKLFRQNFRDVKRINAYLNWYRANIPAFDEISEEDYWPTKNARLDMPVLAIKGETDEVFVSEYLSMTEAISSSFEKLIIENTDHWPHFEDPQTVNQAILEFLEKSSH